MSRSTRHRDQMVLITGFLLLGIANTATAQTGGYGTYGSPGGYGYGYYGTAPPTMGANPGQDGVTTQTTLGTARLIGPLANCQVVFSNFTAKSNTVITESAMNGAFTFLQNSTGNLTVSPGAKCIDTFTNLPLTFPLRGLASNLGHLAVSPAAMLTYADLTPTFSAPLDPSMFTAPFITADFKLAHQYLMGNKSDDAMFTGAIDLLQGLRNGSETQPRRSLAAKGYIAETQLLSLVTVGGAFLAAAANVSLGVAVDAIAQDVQSKKGDASLTSKMAVAAVIKSAANKLPITSQELDWNKLDMPLETASWWIAASNQQLMSLPMDSASAMTVLHAAIGHWVQSTYQAPSVEYMLGKRATAPVYNLSTISINKTAILTSFGLTAASRGGVMALGNLANCTANLWHAGGKLETNFSTSATGSFSINDPTPGMVTIHNSSAPMVCQDSLTNSRLRVPFPLLLPSLPNITYTPIAALASAALALKRAQMAEPGTASLDFKSFAGLETSPLANYTRDLFVSGYQMLGLDEKALAVDLVAFTGDKLQNGQALRAAVAASSAQILGLVSVGTAYVSNLRNAPPAPRVATHFIRAIFNAGLDTKGNVGTLNLTSSASIRSIFMDAVRGSYNEAAYMAYTTNPATDMAASSSSNSNTTVNTTTNGAPNATASSNSNTSVNATASSNSTTSVNATATSNSTTSVNTTTSANSTTSVNATATSNSTTSVNATTSANSTTSVNATASSNTTTSSNATTTKQGRRLLQNIPGLDDASFAQVTATVDSLANTVATTNTIMETTKQAAMAAATSPTASASTKFDMAEALTTIASVSVVQQNDLTQAVAQIAAATTPTSNLTSMLNTFSTSFSGAALDSKIATASSTINTAEVATISTPPTPSTTASPPIAIPISAPVPAPSPPSKKKDKLSKGAKAGIGVGVGIGGLLLIGGVAFGAVTLSKRKQAQMVNMPAGAEV